MTLKPRLLLFATAALLNAKGYELMGQQVAKSIEAALKISQ